MLKWALNLCGLVIACVVIVPALIGPLAKPPKKATSSVVDNAQKMPPIVPAALLTDISLNQNGELKIQKSPDGHYWLDAIVNGHSLKFIVDTGASTITLNKSDAQLLGLMPNDGAFIGQSNTANGIAHIAPIRLSSFSLAQLSWSDVPAMVIDGKMDVNLLGMSFLNRLKSFSFEGDSLILKP